MVLLAICRTITKRLWAREAWNIGPHRCSVCTNWFAHAKSIILDGHYWRGLDGSPIVSVLMAGQDMSSAKSDRTERDAIPTTDAKRRPNSWKPCFIAD